ncbi:hypothetical protein [Thalassotalea marina]|uniref:Uncharacterized protein n=1 Tax=Thalassotalea marina TaxID=1673741 RepID=A0A919EPX0_9GAMM|nr:hypothetical protein [Thalassotalea marina]GHG05629.1 hypothetical protein GCM10017161_39100 [Thalassotalea marina]
MRTILVIACFVLLGCQQPAQQEGSADQKQTQSNETTATVKKIENVERNVQWQIARIQYFDHEGGFFGLVTEDNKRYLPLNLATEFQQHNAKVRFTGKTKPDVMTIKQWGTPFEIEKIEIIEKGVSRTELTH